jgi:hypothetical protein
LLAGTINLVLDRRRRLARAKAAGRLIGVELRVVDEKITSAIDSAKPPSGAANVATASERRPPVDTSGWWLGDLPMDAWRTNQSHLAIDVRPRVLEMLARAYALCAVLNDEHVAAAKNPCQATRRPRRQPRSRAPSAAAACRRIQNQGPFATPAAGQMVTRAGHHAPSACPRGYCARRSSRGRQLCFGDVGRPVWARPQHARPVQSRSRRLGMRGIPPVVADLLSGGHRRPLSAQCCWLSVCGACTRPVYRRQHT